MNLFAIFGLTFLAGIQGNAIPSNEDTIKFMNSMALDVRNHLNSNVEKLRKQGPKLLSKFNTTEVKLTEPGLEIDAKLNNVIWDHGLMDSKVEGPNLNNGKTIITATATSRQGNFVGDLTISGHIEGREVNEERKFKLSYGAYWFKIKLIADGPIRSFFPSITKTGPECKGEDTKAEIIGEEIEGLPKDRLSNEIANELRAQIDDKILTMP